MEFVCCFIKEQYFIDHPSFIKMLDPGNTAKQSRRSYLCLKITADGNDYYIPLRNNLGAEVRAYGRIGHSVPSSTRPSAGLDYRYSLIVKDPQYIDIPASQRIPNTQFDKIASDYSIIEEEFTKYLCGFKKALRKQRVQREALYRESSLINFIDELTEN